MLDSLILTVAVAEDPAGDAALHERQREQEAEAARNILEKNGGEEDDEKYLGFFLRSSISPEGLFKSFEVEQVDVCCETVVRGEEGGSVVVDVVIICCVGVGVGMGICPGVVTKQQQSPPLGTRRVLRPRTMVARPAFAAGPPSPSLAADITFGFRSIDCTNAFRVRFRYKTLVSQV